MSLEDVGYDVGRTTPIRRTSCDPLDLLTITKMNAMSVIRSIDAA